MLSQALPSSISGFCDGVSGYQLHQGIIFLGGPPRAEISLFGAAYVPGTAFGGCLGSWGRGGESQVALRTLKMSGGQWGSITKPVDCILVTSPLESPKHVNSVNKTQQLQG